MHPRSVTSALIYFASAVLLLRPDHAIQYRVYIHMFSYIYILTPIGLFRGNSNSMYLSINRVSVIVVNGIKSITVQ